MFREGLDLLLVLQAPVVRATFGIQGLLGQDVNQTAPEIQSCVSLQKVPGQEHSTTLSSSQHFLESSFPGPLARKSTWPVPSRQLASPPVARHLASSWLPRPQERAPLLLEASRRYVKAASCTQSVFACQKRSVTCLVRSLMLTVSCCFAAPQVQAWNRRPA